MYSIFYSYKYLLVFFTVVQLVGTLAPIEEKEKSRTNQIWVDPPIFTAAAQCAG